MMAENSKKNPWMGLESYREGEVLYGRDDDIRDLSQCVLHDNETLLYGKSGIGKSSILNAGILPSARRHGFMPVIIRLSHKPQDNYFDQIAAAVGQALGGNVQEVVPRHRPDGESLYEYFHRHKFYSTDGERAKLLIIFDQFEEIFTLQATETVKKHFFAELADLLNNVVPAELQREAIQPAEHQEVVTVTDTTNLDDILGGIDLGGIDDAPEYVTDNETHFVFTIREDFISEFEYYTSAIPSFKRNRYGLRPINEEQAAQIILRPVPGLISRDVARLIIEKVTGRTDFELDGLPEIEVDSAVLSLYLNRLYEASGGNTITARLVEQKGGEIIADFYADAISGISDSTVEYLENMLLNGQGRRDNITIYDAINEGHATRAELDTLCNQKKILRQFNYAGDLRIEYIHDILCPVVKAHKDARDLAKQQEAERQRQEEILAEEKRKREEIERQAEAERQRLLAEAEQIKRHNRRRLVVIGTIAGLLGLIWLGVYIANYKSYSIECGNFTTVNGWPVELGEDITDQGKRQLVIHYRLTRQGYWPRRFGGNPFSKVEVLNAKGELTTNAFVELPVVRLAESELDDAKAKVFAQMQKRTATWEYIPSDNGKVVARCVAKDIDGHELYSIQYNRDASTEALEGDMMMGERSDRRSELVSEANDDKYVQWAVFIDAEGNQLVVTDEGVDRMRQNINNGLVTSCLFFTDLGTPQPNAEGHYGYDYERSMLIRQQYCIDKFGDRIDSTVIDYETYRWGRCVKTSKYEVLTPGNNMLVYAYKDYSDTLRFNDRGKVVYGTWHLVNHPFTQLVYAYDDNGQILLNRRMIDDAVLFQRVYSYSGAKLSQVDCRDFFNDEYVERYEYPDKRTTVLSFWKGDEKIVRQMVLERGDTLRCHKRRVSIKSETIGEKTYLVERTDFLDKSDMPIPESMGKYASHLIAYGERIAGRQVKRLEYLLNESGEVYKSVWYGYDEYGRHVSRAVAGIEGTPVRCPRWDFDELCYYTMAVYQTRGIYVSNKGLDEFGTQSYIMLGDKDFKITETPVNVIDTDDSDVGIGLSNYSTERVPHSVNVPYVHLLRKTGTLYRAKLVEGTAPGGRPNPQDGDVLVGLGSWSLYAPFEDLKTQWDALSKRGGEVTVLRVVDGRYTHLKFKVDAGELGAEYHSVPVTNFEKSKINSAV